jgi:pyruvate/2-oxoglutarate/acetoin dehydrogenase E1 component
MVMSYREALNQAMREEMRRDSRIFLIGEEVGYYQGAFKVSKGFVEEFGPQRVVDTPITEAGFTGLAIGAAMAGLHPIVELMTMNFGILALDQIVNNAAKIRYMSGGQLSVPLVIRGPGSAAHQLGAAFAKFRGLVLSRAGVESDRAGHTARCEGSTEERDQGPESCHLHRSAIVVRNEGGCRRR